MNALPFPIQRILVATDLSANAQRARVRAERLARVVGAEVRLLHVTPEHTPEAALGALPDALGDLDGRRLLREAADQPEPWHGPSATGPTAVFACNEQPAAGIVRHAAAYRADLIVMGTHGRQGLRRWAVGSVAERVVRTAPCPVVTLREGVSTTPGPPQRLLVATDLLWRSPPLAAFARGLAAITGAQIDLVHVVRPPTALHPFEADTFRATLPRLAGRLHDRLRALDPGARCVLLVGGPAREVVRFAEAQRSDLLVLATHRGAATGRFAERVMRTAPCPVVSVGIDSPAARPPSHAAAGTRHSLSVSA